MQLYSHHVLAQLASDAGEEGGAAGAKRARTLPSFWAEKAALERQRQRRAQAAAAAAGGGEGGEEEAPAGEGGEGLARGAKRRRMAAGEGGQPAEEDGEGGAEQEPLLDHRCVSAQQSLAAAARRVLVLLPRASQCPPACCTLWVLHSSPARPLPVSAACSPVHSAAVLP